MSTEEALRVTHAGDLVLLVARNRKTLTVRLEPGAEVHTHHGVLHHDQLIGAAWGAIVCTHTGYPFRLLRPTTADIVRDLKRTTQIVYPKDAGYILLKLGIRPGCQVVEAGTGSGGLTLVLAQAVQPTGRVYSYDNRADVQNLARKNLERLGLACYVEFKLRDIAAGFDEQDVDALFLDLPTPWEYLAQARRALANGGFFGSILPTTNQVETLLAALPHCGFAQIEVEELLLRPYQAISSRLRPMDRMVAHTGYLIFAQAVVGEGCWAEQEQAETAEEGEEKEYG